MPKTGETNGHTHDFENSASGTTSEDNGHTHNYDIDKEITEPGGDDSHTHTIK